MMRKDDSKQLYFLLCIYLLEMIVSHISNDVDSNQTISIFKIDNYCRT